MFLHNVKIRSKLFIAFGLFIVLMMVSSGLSLLSLDRSNSGMQNIITNDYPITVKANLLIDNFQEFVSTQQLMLLDEEGKWTQASQKKLDTISQQISALLDALSAAPLNDASKKLLRISAMCVSSIWLPDSAFCRRCRITIAPVRCTR